MDGLMGEEPRQMIVMLLGILVVAVLILFGVLLDDVRVEFGDVEVTNHSIPQEAHGVVITVSDKADVPYVPIRDMPSPEDEVHSDAVHKEVDLSSLHKEIDSIIDAENTVLLLRDKKMSTDHIEIAVGETLKWVNDDDYPHKLRVEYGKTLIAESNKLYAGDEFVQTFGDFGEFVVRDMFAGSLRMTVTVS